MDKKRLQLGMNPSTASGRLVKDLLWHYVVHNRMCYRCKNLMARENFSIEHKTPWLDSDDPLGLYFDLDNVTFSHQSCNSAASRVVNKVHSTIAEGSKVRMKKWRDGLTSEEKKADRRKRYLRHGC